MEPIALNMVLSAVNVMGYLMQTGEQHDDLWNSFQGRDRMVDQAMVQASELVTKLAVMCSLISGRCCPDNWVHLSVEAVVVAERIDPVLRFEIVALMLIVHGSPERHSVHHSTVGEMAML